MATGRDGRTTLAVPLALRLAARIQERPIEQFRSDPTQLANGLRDLLDAVAPDGVAVTLAAVLAPEVDGGLNGPRTECALEATRRLRATVGDSAVLLAGLPASPGAVLLDAARRFITAGVDVLLLDSASTAASSRTILNIARFHRVVAASREPAAGFTVPQVIGLDTARPEAGLVITPDDVPEQSSVVEVQGWVRAVRI